MTDSPLFRQQALQYQSDKLYGAIILTRHWSYAALTLLFSFIAIVLIVFFMFAGYTRKETVSGVIAPSAGLVRIAAPQASVVRTMSVRIGQDVKAGDILFVLASERESQRGETQDAVNAALSSRIDKLRSEIVNQQRQAENSARNGAQRIDELRGELAQIAVEIGLVQQRVQLAQGAANRFVELQKKQFVSPLQTEEKLAQALDEEARLHALLRTKSNLQRELSTQQAEYDDVPLHAKRETSELEREIGTAQKELAESEAERELIVRATQSGRITAVLTEMGQSVAAQQPLVTLLPSGSTLEAELYLPTRAIGFVRIGNDVMLRYAAFPYQKFGQQHGVVREISRSTVTLSDLKLANSSIGEEPVYRIRIKLDQDGVIAFGALQPLQPGMQLEASILLEYRKLYEWVLDPLFALKKRLV